MLNMLEFILAMLLRRNSNIMRKTRYSSGSLNRLFEVKKIATMAELKTTLGTGVDMTVFRKLRELSYLSSYSHRGKYYTLRALAEFNEQGLWTYRSAHFSVYGTLVETVYGFVNKSEGGYSAYELEKVLSTSTKQPLLHLFRCGRVYRERLSGQYVYFCKDCTLRRRQIVLRRGRLINEAEESEDEVQAAIVLFYTLLDEKQRRLYAGLESLKVGPDGDKEIGKLLGLDTRTVARGRIELLRGEVDSKAVRKAGGGRKGIKKNT